MAGKGGAREGAGRPAGTLNKRTLERMAQKRHFVQRVLKSTDTLFNAQLDKAIGEKHLMVKRTEYSPRGAVVRQWHEIVEDPQTIIDYLDGELEDGESISGEDNYYYMSTKPADNMAIANMLDRAYGKPTEKVELGAPGEDELSEISEEELNARIDRYLDQRRKSR